MEGLILGGGGGGGISHGSVDQNMFSSWKVIIKQHLVLYSTAIKQIEEGL